MEFQRFWKEKQRMCDYYKMRCRDNKCPLFEVRSRQYYHNCLMSCGDFPQEAEQIVEKWAKENPIVTNWDKYKDVMEKTFGKVYPDGTMKMRSSGGQYGICAADAWWNQEYKEPEEEK